MEWIDKILQKPDDPIWSQDFWSICGLYTQTNSEYRLTPLEFYQFLWESIGSIKCLNDVTQLPIIDYERDVKLLKWLLERGKRDLWACMVSGGQKYVWCVSFVEIYPNHPELKLTAENLSHHMETAIKTIKEHDEHGHQHISSR